MSEDAEITCADWCAYEGACDSGTACLSASEDRRLRLTGNGTSPDENGVQQYTEARIYLQRNIGWGRAGMPDAAVVLVRISLDHEGWCGGTDVALTPAEAVELAAHLTRCAGQAAMDQTMLLAAGHTAAKSVTT